MGFYIVFHKLASPYMSQLLGAIVVSSAAVLAGLIILFSHKVVSGSIELNWSWLGVLFLFVVGLCALSLDTFSLKAFASDLPVSIVGPIIFGLGTALPVIVGVIFFKEQLDVIKLISVLMIIIGCIILSSR